jgi:hypothetical protein
MFLAPDLSIAAVKTLSKIPFASINIPAFPPLLLILFYAGFLIYFISSDKASRLSFPQPRTRYGDVGNPSENEERFRTSRNDRMAAVCGFANDRFIKHSKDNARLADP